MEKHNSAVRFDIETGISKGESEVATVAVFDGTKLLMGKRRDNGRWTLPGGHLDDGEAPQEGAKREVAEEAGIEAQGLKHIGTEDVTTYTGKKKKIHAFRAEHDGSKPSSKDDPDEEVEKWEWIDTANGLPDHVATNLHSPKNVTLRLLGLQKSMGDGHIESIFKSIWGDQIMDLIKSKPHKYLRKYKRGSSWVYIYHEGEQHGRPITEEAYGHIKELAELGDHHAKALHKTLVEHHPEKLALLRELADHGDADAVKHLKRLGIDRKQERLEEALIPAALRGPKDPVDEELSSVDVKKAHKAIEKAVKEKIFGYLETLTTSPYATSLAAHSVDLDSVMSQVKPHKNIRGMLEGLHRGLRGVDRAHHGLPESRNTGAVSAGGYGNLAYNTAIRELETAGIVPEGYLDVQNRNGENRNQEEHQVHPIKGIREARERARAEAAKRRRREEAAQRERQERERAEAETRLRAEHGDLLSKHGESAADIISYFNLRASLEDRVKLMKGIDRYFGKDFKFKEFKDNIQGHADVNVEIGSGFATGLMNGSTSMSVSFAFKEKSTGNQITSASRVISKGRDGEIIWNNGSFGRASNANLDRYPGMAGGLYQGVEKTLLSITKNWTGKAKENTVIQIPTCANSGWGDGYKGALVWAKHCFDWAGASRAADWSVKWKNKSSSMLARLGVPANEVTKLHDVINKAKYPSDFVSTGFVLNREQALKALGKSSFDHDFEKIFEKKGYVDIGELIMIDSGTSWSGVNWINRKTGRPGELNKRRKKIYAGERSAGQPSRFTVTEPTRRSS